MGLETSFNYISDLDAANPTSGDNSSQGDDHLRGIKNVLKTTFPNVSGAVTPTHTELNYVDGVTSAIQTQLDGLVSIAQNLDPAAAGTTYTLVAGDANKHLYKNGAAAETWTIPQNSSVAFPVGTVVNFVNDAATGAITVARDTNVVLRLAGTGGDANRTVAVYGIATILKVATNTWYISGAGVS